MKNIYDYCVNVDWNEDKIAEYANKLGLTYEEMKELVLDYAKNHVKKKVYDEIIKKLNSQMLEDEFYNLKELNPVLLSLYGIRTYRIWRNEYEKRIVLKHMYKMWKDANLETETIEKEFGISQKEVFSLLKIYAISYLGITEKEWQGSVVKDNAVEKTHNYSVSKLVGIYDALIEAETLEEIIKIIDSEGYNTTYLRSHLHDYLIRYRCDDYDKYKELIISKFKIYSKNKRFQKQEKQQHEKEETRKRYVDEMLPKATKLVKMFIESPYFTPEEFFEKEEVGVNTNLSIIDIFNECLKLVKEYNKELYQCYLEKIENGKKKFYNDYISDVLTLISLIRNGIEENGIKRSFDLIDYFQFTSLSLSDLLKLARKIFENKEITAKEYGVVSKFVANNKKGELESERDITSIYAEERIVNVIRNTETGVFNTLETIQDEMKDKLINYLRNNNIPVNFLTYNAVLTRYQIGQLLLEDSKAY